MENDAVGRKKIRCDDALLFGISINCADFPCKPIQNLEKSYTKKYATSLIENGNTAREKGVAAFLAQDARKWTCGCGGAFSLHDGVCSECGSAEA